MPTRRKRTPIGLSFAAGTLFGAIAVFVPLSSAGHSIGARDAFTGAASSAAPASTSKPAGAGADAKAQAAAESNTATCDVQLD